MCKAHSAGGDVIASKGLKFIRSLLFDKRKTGQLKTLKAVKT